MLLCLRELDNGQQQRFTFSHVAKLASCRGPGYSRAYVEIVRPIPPMSMRNCTCGAEPEVRRETRPTADGRSETFFRVACPVCGQIGPAVSATGKDEAAAIAEAVDAWNAMIARIRPSEA